MCGLYPEIGEISCFQVFVISMKVHTEYNGVNNPNFLKHYWFEVLWYEYYGFDFTTYFFFTWILKKIFAIDLIVFNKLLLLFIIQCYIKLEW